MTAQHIDGRSGGHLWAERYDRELADIFAVQDDVTGQIVRALEIKLVDAGPAPPSRVETDNPEAYDCVLRGRELYRLYTKDGNAAARRLYERAIELDPSYAEAHAGWPRPAGKTGSSALPTGSIVPANWRRRPSASIRTCRLSTRR